MFYRIIDELDKTIIGSHFGSNHIVTDNEFKIKGLENTDEYDEVIAFVTGYTYYCYNKIKNCIDIYL